jgi:hypothetical protein
MKKTALLIGIIGVFLLIKPLSAQTWFGAKRLTWAADCYSWAPSLAINTTNNLHIVWYEYDMMGDTESINYIKSTDWGGTWSTTRELISMPLGNLGDPVIASDSSNNIYIVWNQWVSGANYDIFQKKSTDGGNTWSTSKRLSWTSGGSGAHCIAIDSTDTIHIAWGDHTYGNPEILYKKSTNGGVTWSGTKRLTWNSGYSSGPDIAFDSSDSIYLAWWDNEPGNAEIFFKRSTDGGTSWTTKRLTWNSGDSMNPVISVDSGDEIYIIWDDNSPGNGEIYLKKSTNNGVVWTTKRLTWNSGNSSASDLAIDTSDNLHIVWENETSGDYEIFYKRSTNGGANWATQRLTWNSGDSSASCISTDSAEFLHVVWSDSTPGNDELFYRKGNQKGIVLRNNSIQK